MPTPDDTLRRNLAAIRRTDPALADLLTGTAPAAVTFTPARQQPANAAAPVLTATVPAGDTARPVALASQYDPAKEAARLVESVDLESSACVVVLGVGLGYHAAVLAERMSERGMLIAYEPDPAVLRAVLERVDHSRWLGRSHVTLCTGEVDQAALVRRVETRSGVVTQGLALVTHPPTRQRSGEALATFAGVVKDTLAYCRTTVATALVNSARTCRNLACNLGYYHAGATTDELVGAAKGYPAVCVAAGPSLARNVHLLQDENVRRNVVVIAAQTALKPLLDRGVRPDFVTALDYSAICKRFYEGLPELPDVTLVAESKANPVILDAFPGPVRVTQAAFNDRLLGHPDRGGLARPIAPVKAGATVAHLSYYVALHLGCDPIVLIGQDLGFSDGLYYMPGTAIHQVWSPELNPFCTVESMEWVRVARMKAHLRKMKDVHDRPIYSDEQMVTYLRQFERDFAEAAAAGQTVIDATEGGMPKAHTQRMPLAEALAEHATRPVPEIPVPPRGLDADKLDRLAAVLDRRIDELKELRRSTEQAVPILRDMKRKLDDRPKLAQLFAKLRKHQKRVHEELTEVFQIVNQVNTVGTFRRQKADRTILQAGHGGKSKEAAQIDRDLENLKWLGESADEVRAILDEARQRLEQQRRDARAADTTADADADAEVTDGAMATAA